MKRTVQLSQRCILLLIPLFFSMHLQAQDYTCPNDQSFCSNDPEIHLRELGSFPSGGTFYVYDTPVPSEIIFPFQYPEGETLPITYTSPPTLFFQCSFTIEIKPAPELLCPQHIEQCFSYNTIELSDGFGFEPPGGVFSGDYISPDGSFDMASAGPGYHTISYSVTDPDGDCNNSCETLIEIINGEGSVPDYVVEICTNGEPYDLTTIPDIMPPGGQFSGNGVDVNHLYPEIAGEGTHEITYHVEYQGRECDYWGTFTVEIVISEAPECPDDITLCGTDAGIVGLPVYDYVEWGYTGPGINYTADGYYFDPEEAGPGTHTITLITQDPPCPHNECTFEITVYNTELGCPELLWVCPGEETDLTMLWNFNPLGSFSGDQVSAEGVFSAPIIYGESECYPVTYTLVYDDDCVVSCDFIVCVDAMPVIECTEIIHVCLDDDPFNPMPGLPGDTWVNGQQLGNNMFNPAEWGAGTFEAAYSHWFGDNIDCEIICNFIIIVHPLPGIECPDDMVLCSLSGEAIDLPAQSGYASYTYSGSGVGGSPGSQQFSPEAAGAGSHTITLTVTDEFGCSANCEFTITVGDINMQCPDTIYVCPENDLLLSTINISPQGGTFSGNHIVDGYFDPPYSMEEHCYEIMYKINDENDCEDSCTIVICVDAWVELQVPSQGITVCPDDEAFEIPVSHAGGSFIMNGRQYSGTSFDPAQFEPGEYLFSYVYYTPAPYNCFYSDGFIITVLSAPELDCPEDTLTFCEGDPAITLDGLILPSGGIYYNENGAEIASFNPSTAGNFSITYTYTDPETLCSAECTVSIIVYPAPDIDCPDDIIVCQGDPDIQLSSPTHNSGTYTYNGIPITGFSTTTPGTYTIVNSRKDPDTGCYGTCEFTITVKPKPYIFCPPDTAVCSDTERFSIYELLGNINPNADISFQANDEHITATGMVIPEQMNPGSYEIWVFAELDGCIDSCSFILEIVETPLPPICPPDMAFCNGDEEIILNEIVFDVSGNMLQGSVTFNAEYGLKTSPTHNFTIFDPGSVPPEQWGIPIVITVTHCNTSTDRSVFCCSECTFTITIIENAEVICPPDTIVCEDSPAINLNDLVSPPGGEFIEMNNFYQIDIFEPYKYTSGDEVTIFYYYPYRGASCGDSCSFKIKVREKPFVSVRDTIATDSEVINIENDNALWASSLLWETRGDGTFDDNTKLHPAYTPGDNDFETGRTTLTLNAYNDVCSASADMEVYLSHNITIINGWGAFSAYRDGGDDGEITITFAEEVAEDDDDSDILFVTIDDGEITIVYPLAFQALWNPREAYYYKSNKRGEFKVPGQSFAGEQFDAKQGSSLMPVYSWCAISVDEVQFGDGLILLKEIAGRGVYIPGKGIKTINYLHPGKAYAVLYAHDDVVTFPHCVKSVNNNSEINDDDVVLPEEWGDIHYTPFSHVIVLPGNLITEHDLVAGDIIGAFTPEGIFAGFAVVGTDQTIVLFADDPLTDEKDGFAVGDEITFKVYKNSNESISDLDPVFIDGEVTFNDNGIDDIEDVSISSVDDIPDINFDIYPNPAKTVLNIKTNIEGSEARIIDISGRIIELIQLEKGINAIEIKNYNKGLYNISIISKEGVYTRKLIKN
jgi:hypothetical protein